MERYNELTKELQDLDTLFQYELAVGNVFAAVAIQDEKIILIEEVTSLTALIYFEASLTYRH